MSNNKKEMPDLEEILLDPNNRSNIVLYNEKDEPLEFEQIAIVPWEDDRLFVILHPLNSPHVKDDEAIVFSLEKDSDGVSYLATVYDDDLVNEVFNEYLRLLEESSN